MNKLDFFGCGFGFTSHPYKNLHVGGVETFVKNEASCALAKAWKCEDSDDSGSAMVRDPRQARKVEDRL